MLFQATYVDEKGCYDNCKDELKRRGDTANRLQDGSTGFLYERDQKKTRYQRFLHQHDEIIDAKPAANTW